VTHAQRTEEPAEIAHGIDQANGRRCRGVAQKLGEHGTESRMERVIRTTYYDEEDDGERHVRSRADGEKKAQAAEQHGSSGVPTALASAVGMPTVQLLGEEASQVRQGGEQRHLQIALAG